MNSGYLFLINRYVVVKVTGGNFGDENTSDTRASMLIIWEGVYGPPTPSTSL